MYNLCTSFLFHHMQSIIEQKDYHRLCIYNRFQHPEHVVRCGHLHGIAFTWYMCSFVFGKCFLLSTVARPTVYVRLFNVCRQLQLLTIIADNRVSLPARRSGNNYCKRGISCTHAHHKSNPFINNNYFIIIILFCN